MANNMMMMMMMMMVMMLMTIFVIDNWKPKCTCGFFYRLTTTEDKNSFETNDKFNVD